ncbi:MAG TPA: thioesterase family protein [Patescibacteria group bacterium]|nr:thioesterase family protein [Patescibacteria group bacterium]
MSALPVPPRRDDFRYTTEIQTRWSDNDMFGHLNNVTYNRFFEAVVVAFFRDHVPLDLEHDPVIPYAAEIMCRFGKALSFPETVEGALRVERVGNSSVRYALALFRKGDDEASAFGHWVHVFVGRADERPAPIPEPIREAFLGCR